MSANEPTTSQGSFDSIAAEYDVRFGRTLAHLEEVLRSNADFIGVKPGGRLLDYACGTGLVSRALGSDLRECIGVDVSANMVDYYNAKAKALGLYPHRQSGHAGNLVRPGSEGFHDGLGEAQFYGFDVAGVGLGFHHFSHHQLAVQRLAERLTPGGSFFLLDFLGDKEHAAGHHHSGHAGTSGEPAGFSEEGIKAIFQGAGVSGNFAFKDLGPVEFHDAQGKMASNNRRCFIARGSKL